MSAEHVAEADGNRTRQTEMLGLTGFEDRGAHQDARRLRIELYRVGRTRSFTACAEAGRTADSNDPRSEPSSAQGALTEVSGGNSVVTTAVTARRDRTWLPLPEAGPMRAELFVPPLAFHAEGPVWWPDDGSPVAHTLRYVDMLAGRILTVDPDAFAAGSRDASTEAAPTPVTPDMVAALDVPGPVAACLRPRRGGGIAVLTEHGLSVSDDPAGGEWTPLVELLTDPDIRLNEGGCDPAGRLLAGTMRYDQRENGATLFQISGDGAVSTVFDDVTISNGIAWSRSGDRAYYNDTPTRSTWVLDWSEDAGLSQPRRLFTLDPDDPAGGPDGLCLDAEDNVWTAIYGGSRVECRDVAGTLLEVVDLPVTNVTACTFGGPDLRTLFITTSQEDLTPGAQPEAGAVFAAEPGVTGVPVTPFAG